MWIKLTTTDSSDCCRSELSQLLLPAFVPKSSFKHVFMCVSHALRNESSDQWVTQEVTHTNKQTNKHTLDLLPSWTPPWRITTVSERECAHSGCTTCDGSVLRHTGKHTAHTRPQIFWVTFRNVFAAHSGDKWWVEKGVRKRCVPPLEKTDSGFWQALVLTSPPEVNDVHPHKIMCTRVYEITTVNRNQRAG